MHQIEACHFTDFFEAVHGFRPFLWQQQLAEEVIERRAWPSLVDLPTAAGKTAAIDAALFHLAYEAERADRRAPVRILFVIDRQIVVDSTFYWARKIMRALRDSGSPAVVRAVASRLSAISGDTAHPLDVVRLRGGVPREGDWARSPCQPLIAVSTVDQVGSRLLFRGYGVSPKMWPVHAGLVGSDALWLLDEVHLSKPLEETLEAIEDGYSDGWLADHPRSSPFALVRLSATPGEHKPNAFTLSMSDKNGERRDEQLWVRLEARKIAKLRDYSDHTAAADFAREALSLAHVDSTASPRRVAVVVNTVDLARDIFTTLERQAGARFQCALLIGRIRPLDRAHLGSKIEVFRAHHERPDLTRPFILVATQTIEVGADLDFDALVSEIAPLDILRQRFGRVARLGMPLETQAVILSPLGLKPKKEKGNAWSRILRLYGDPAVKTKEWLTKESGKAKTIDFGFLALDGRLPKDPVKLEELLAPRRNAPVLMLPYIEQWWTTSPPSLATPDPSLFLHGCQQQADVRIAWRADADPNSEDTQSAGQASLIACPPSSPEIMSVPIWAVRAWLRNNSRLESDIADVPAEESPGNGGKGGTTGRACLRYDNRYERWTRALPADLRPGDLIVVPCSYGGSDEYGWNPASTKAVRDVGTQSHYVQRRRGAVRLHRRLFENQLGADGLTDGAEAPRIPEAWSRVKSVINDFERGDVSWKALARELSEIDGLPDSWRTLLVAISKKRVIDVARFELNRKEAGIVVSSRLPLGARLLDDSTSGECEEPGAEAITASENSANTGVEVNLDVHLRHVGDKARTFGKLLNIGERLSEIIALAGSLHDLGKADPRFQADLHGDLGQAKHNTPSANFNGTLLAKSANKPRRSGSLTPRNFRHEALSVALAERHPRVRELDDDDKDLLLWLVGTHHGYGRPFFRALSNASDDTVARVAGLTIRAADAPIRLDQGWIERAGRLLRKFGPWELARFEAIVRLADHQASEAEQLDG